MVSLSLRKDKKDLKDLKEPPRASIHSKSPKKPEVPSAAHTGSADTKSDPKDQPKRQTSISSSLKSLFIKSPKLQPSSGGPIPPETVLKSSNVATIEEAAADPEAELEVLASTGLSPLPTREEPLQSVSRANSMSGRKNSLTLRADSKGRTSRRGSGNVEVCKKDLIPSVVEGSLRVYEDGTHEHILKPMKVLEKPPAGSGILSGLLRKGSSNVNGDVAFSLLPEQNRINFQNRLSIQSRKTFDENDEDNIDEVYEANESSDDEEDNNIENYDIPIERTAAIGDSQLNLINKLSEQINNNEDPTISPRSYNLSDKYGKFVGIIGKGSYGIVKLVSKKDMTTKKEIFYAVKELKRREGEDVNHFSTRLTSEFVISNSLNHLNIVRTIDLMKNSHGTYSEIMEYCSGGDLYSYISKNGRDGLNCIEADCIMKQIMNGISYMHSRGVAHCDIKPENILLTINGVAKISDFGTSAVFKTAWEKDVHFSSGACGSEPYVAPEEFTEREYDPRGADIWATGVLYLTMMTGTYAWIVSKESEDDLYEKYLKKRPSQGRPGTFEPIESLKYGEFFKSRKSTLYGMLDPNPNARLNAISVLKSAWIEKTRLCEAAKEFDFH